MAEQWELDEEGIRRLGALTLEQPELVESLSLQGSYAGKIHSIGDAFRNFKSLRSLDLSRNLITSLKGIQYLCSLQDLNLYYNNIPSLVEVSRLQPLPFLKELDLRLNPVVRKDTDYRLFAVYMLQTLEKLDDRAVRESERKAAKLHFSQLGNSENFLLEVEKSSREKTVKNCVTNESTASKVSTDSDNRIETESHGQRSLAGYSPLGRKELNTTEVSWHACMHVTGAKMQEVARREMPSENNQEDDLYAATHFNSDPALVVNVEQQLATSLSDLTQAHGSFPNNSILGDSLRTLLLPTGTSENRENLTKRSLSPSRRGFRRKENILATLNTKHGFRDATGSEPLSSDLGSLHGLPGNHSPPVSARTSHVATVLRQLLELVDKHWNGSGSLLLNKKFLAFKTGPCAQPEFLAGPARDLLLTLVVPAPSQQWCRSHPEDTSKAFHRREMELKETGQLVPNDMEGLKQKLVRVLEENLILSEKVQRLEEGATTSIVSGHPSHTYDDLLRKNQQLNMQVSCLNQELAQLKKLEETVTLLHESQRSLVVTNEYLLQQLNKEQKGYSGKALLPPEKSHHLGRSSPFGKSTLSSSSPVAHDMGHSGYRERETGWSESMCRETCLETKWSSSPVSADWFCCVLGKQIQLQFLKKVMTGGQDLLLNPFSLRSDQCPI
ncbi:leucine-rich repeat-containing protein 36 isoform X11 [Bos javanicus]|uniref:leucine-rich repeat-containing protein 36 isoform X11 n=1 Tax=Bos javanicus TaxID=9906 RepID=UPI002AA67357|nr:leucine-rich repeat-containing protein 36 isoform X11 [Bos javanicus]